MTKEEKELVFKKNSELTLEERQRALHVTAHVKRLIDLIFQLPGAADEFVAAPEGFLAKYNVDLSIEDACFFIMPADPVEKLRIINENDLDAMPESYFRYRQFINNKYYFRDLMINKLCAPSNEKLRKWRERQIKRCYSELGGVNKSFIHTMLCMELADGCSVGCEFCGLEAGKLKGLFRYTDENAELFRGVISKCHEIIGDAAGYGMMYFATEPMDNPDYELFEKDYYNEFGVVPQITTAAVTRDLERMRRFVHEMMEGRGFIHRFTITSEEMAREVLDFFTAEELLYVELLPQYPEAPSFVPYTKAGRLNEDEEPEGEPDAGTIVCVDGFAINFVRKTLTMFTPTRAGKGYSKGISEMPPVTFNDPEDFGRKLTELIEKYAVVDVPEDEALSLYSWFSLVKAENGEIYLASKYGEKFKIQNESMVKVVELLKEGRYTKHQIVEKMVDETGAAPEIVYWSVNTLWKNGVIKDTVFFKEGK